MRLKNLVRIGTNKQDDIISKGGNAGFLGLIQDISRKGSAMKYNPFAGAAGNISQSGGFNKGVFTL